MKWPSWVAVALAFMLAGGWLAVIVAAILNERFHAPVLVLGIGPIIAASLFGGAYILRRNGR